MREYDVRFCKCGHIHLIPFEKIENAIEKDEHFLFICADCGAATIIGADIERNVYEDGETYYNMYSFEFSPDKSKEINSLNFKRTKEEKAISEIYYSRGIKVPMMNGFYATRYYDGKFYDDRVIFNIYEIDRFNVTAKEVQDFLEKDRYDASTVDMKTFIRQNDDEVLEELSHYCIQAFHWAGTKYEREWNK